MAALLGWMIIIGSLLIGFLAINVIIFWLRSHRLRIRDPMNRRAYIEDYWMLEKKEKKTGILYWKSVWWRKKIQTPKPPMKALEVGKRGKKFAECYRLSEDEYIWIADAGIKIKRVEGKLQAFEIQKNGQEKSIDSFKAFTPTQRQVLINQHIKAEEISKRRWTTGEIAGMISFGILGLVIIMALIFGGDIINNIRQFQSQNIEAQKQNLELTKAMAAREAILAKVMGTDLSDISVSISQEVKPQKTSEVVEGTTGNTPPSIDI